MPSTLGFKAPAQRKTLYIGRGSLNYNTNFLRYMLWKVNMHGHVSANLRLHNFNCMKKKGNPCKP